MLSDRILVNARRPRRVDRRAASKTDGSLIWKIAERRAGVFVGGAPRGRRRAAGDLLHRRSARSASTSTDGRLLWSYNRVANRTANIATPIVARQPRLPVVGLRNGCRAAGAERRRQRRDGERGLLHATRCGTTTPARCWSATTSTASPTRILTAMKFDTGKVAWRDRSVGKGSLVVRRRPPLPLQRKRRRSGSPRPIPAGYREHGRFQIKTGSLPTWSHPVVSGGKLFLRDQDTIYAYDVARQVDC